MMTYEEILELLQDVKQSCPKSLPSGTRVGWRVVVGEIERRILERSEREKIRAAVKERIKFGRGRVVL